MRRSTPALVLCLAAGAQVGALVSLASAHGTSAGAGPSSGAMAPLIILAGIGCFALYHFFVGRK